MEVKTPLGRENATKRHDLEVVVSLKVQKIYFEGSEEKMVLLKDWRGGVFIRQVDY